MVTREAEGSGETRLETLVSYVLITGVMISLIFEVAGMLFLYRASHSMVISQDVSAFVHGRNFFIFLGRVVRETRSGTSGLHLMLLGIVMLILTPYIRAALSVIYFASRKNVKYFLITLFVLAVLSVSMTMH